MNTKSKRIAQVDSMKVISEAEPVDRNIISSIHTPSPSYKNIAPLDLYRDIEEISCAGSDISFNLLSRPLTSNQLRSLPQAYRDCLFYVGQADSSKFSPLADKDYASQLALIALSDTPVARSIVTCGKKSFGAKRCNLCGRKRLCPYCARCQGAKVSKNFQNVFTRSTWGHLTISYTGAMGFNGLDHNRWHLHWDAAVHALKRACAIGLLPGAIVREELHLESYTPQHVLPHVHAIVSTDTWTPAMEARLCSFMEGYRDDEADHIDLVPNFEFKAITEADALRNAIFYVEKAVDLVTPYQNFFYKYPDPTPQSVVNLNRACRDFVESYLVGAMKKTQVHYFGNLHPNAKSFIGNRAVRPKPKKAKLRLKHTELAR